MAKFLGTLMPAIIDSDCGEKVVFLNIESQKAYDINGKQLAEEESLSIFSAMGLIQEENMQEIPYEKIYQVMETEKRLSEDNNKHIFRRS